MKLCTLLIIAICSGVGFGAPPCDTLEEFIDQHQICTEVKLTQLDSDVLAEYGPDAELYPANYTSLICKGAIDAYINCMGAAFAGCTTPTPSLADHITNSVDNYRARFCKPGTDEITDEIEMYLDDYDVVFGEPSNSQCTTQLEIQRLWNECSVDVLVWLDPIYQDPFLDVLDNANSAMTSSMECMRNTLHSTNAGCSEETYQAILKYLDWSHIPLGVHFEFSAFADEYNPAPHSARRSTCHVIGDPHLVLCTENVVTTCAAPGYIKYFENQFLSVYAQNDPSCNGCTATVVTNITITFYVATSASVNEYTYTAMGDLPTTFTNGDSTVNSGQPNEIAITSVNNFVRIVQAESGVVIVIFKQTLSGGTVAYFFTIRAADSLIDLSTGLLIDGCNDEIDTTGGRRKRSAECDSVCAPVPAMFADSCQFDCSVTGDAAFAGAQAQVTAMEETCVEVDDQIIIIFEQEDDDEENDDNGAGAMTTKLCLLVALLGFIVDI